MTFLTTAIIPIFDCPSSPNWPALGKPTRKRVPAAEAEGNLESGLCALTSDCAPWRHARSVHQETIFPRHRVNMTVFWIVVVLCEILAPLCLAAPLILKCMQDCSTPSPYKPHPSLSCLDVYPTRRARGFTAGLAPAAIRNAYCTLSVPEPAIVSESRRTQHKGYGVSGKSSYACF